MGRIYVPPGSSYSGPGDLGIGSASAFYSVRGYSQAYASPGTNPCLTLVDQSGGNSQVFNIRQTGEVDVKAIATWKILHSVTTIQISKLWDQSGNGHHFDSTGTGIWPVLTLNVLNGHPVMSGQASAHIQSTPNLALTGLTSLSMVVNRTAGTSTLQQLYNNNSQYSYGWAASANQFGEVSGGSGTLSITDSAPHAIQMTCALTSGTFYMDNGVNNQLTSANLGTFDVTGGGVATMFNGPNGFAAQQVQGYCAEFSIWNIAFNSTKRALLDTSQRTWFGF
jgi:hypothetical protein